MFYLILNYDIIKMLIRIERLVTMGKIPVYIGRGFIVFFKALGSLLYHAVMAVPFMIKSRNIGWSSKNYGLWLGYDFCSIVYFYTFSAGNTDAIGYFLFQCSRPERPEVQYGSESESEKTDQNQAA